MDQAYQQSSQPTVPAALKSWWLPAVSRCRGQLGACCCKWSATLEVLLQPECKFESVGYCSHKDVSIPGHLLCTVQALAVWLQSCCVMARLT
jgi:hypothetical protein